MEKLIFKFTWNYKGPQVAKTILKKEQSLTLFVVLALGFLVVMVFELRALCPRHALYHLSQVVSPKKKNLLQSYSNQNGVV
jgi:hypothetical protein